MQAICTLFEKGYHVGLGVFTNSLYASGYRGVVYAGYRGKLPPWAGAGQPDHDVEYVFEVTEGVLIHFIPLPTDQHFTNMKPDFMLDLWERFGQDWTQLFYFDPDIVLKGKWERFREWAEMGVALCEDMKSPLPRRHPLRMQWRKYYAAYGIDVQPQDDYYVNGGFVGVDQQHRSFLHTWKKVQDLMKEKVGKPQEIEIGDRWNLFQIADQDALNVAKDIYREVCLMPMHGMDFGSLGYVMSHAAGAGKPWTKNYLSNILFDSDKPANTDKMFWRNAKSPITVYDNSTIARKQLVIKFASLLGRVVRKS